VHRTIRGCPRLDRLAPTADSSPVLRVLILALALAVAGCGASIPPGVVEVRAASRLDALGDRVSSPPDETAWAGAPPTALPDRWDTRERLRASAAWYHSEFGLDATPTAAWAVYLPLATPSATVWVNGVEVGATGRRNVNRPFLAVAVPAVLRQGRNIVDIRLRVPPTYGSVLGRFFVGPAAALRPSFERRVFWQVHVVELSVFVTFAFAALGLALWARRRSLPGVIECAVGGAGWGVAMLELVVSNPPLPELAWQWTVTSGLPATIVAFTVGARRALHVERSWGDQLLAGSWVVGALALAAALASRRPAATDAVVLGWALWSVGVGIYLLTLLARIQRASSLVSLRIAAPVGALGFAVAARDVALGLGAATVGPPVILLPYLGCVLGVWGSWRILERFVAALDESQALNRDLERRVEERGDEIARSYERINSLERERAVQDERARLMQDIHDGFGAQLTSMLALVETAEATPGEVADALRDALDDMRLVIQSLGPRDADLIALLASWRARVERRLQRRGLRFDWQVSDLPVLPWLGPRESLHVLRIFQETVSNVLQHAAATTITVRTGERVGTDGRQGVYVQIDDDGRGFAPDGRDGAAPGAGLRNITRRARDLGGVVSIGRETGGGRVVLWLPRDSA